jgi:hypothetical protein
MQLSELVGYSCFVLILAAVVVTGVATARRGWPGVAGGLLAVIGAILCFYFLPSGLAVALEDPRGPLQKDSILLNGAGLIGLTLVFLGTRLGLRRRIQPHKPDN